MIGDTPVQLTRRVPDLVSLNKIVFSHLLLADVCSFDTSIILVVDDPTEHKLQRSARYSDCGTYRYVLQRGWDSELPSVLFVALNPSTADHTSDDPTVRRCIGFARSWGFGRLVIANIFAFRSTDPSALASARDPIGPENDRWLNSLSTKADLTIAAWGAHGGLYRRAERVLPTLKNAHHLGRTRDGYPRHPLYLPSSIKPIRF